MGLHFERFAWFVSALAAIGAGLLAFNLLTAVDELSAPKVAAYAALLLALAIPPYLFARAFSALRATRTWH